jgi:ankyrin repeat protein
MHKEWQDAIRQRDLDKVHSLLENGEDINSKDAHGQTALMNAAHTGQLELAKLLVEKGADLNITAKYNLSALMLSLIAHHTAVAQLLITAGTDLNIRSTKAFQGKTALSLAEDGGHAEIAALLKQQGAIS